MIFFLGLISAIVLQFEPFVGVGVMDGGFVDLGLHFAYYIDTAYIGGSSVEVVFGAEEDVVRCKGKEDRRNFAEAVCDREDVDHILSCS